MNSLPLCLGVPQGRLVARSRMNALREQVQRIEILVRRNRALATLLCWICCWLPFVSAQEPAGDYFAYVGSYTHPNPPAVSTSKGIYAFRFDSKSGVLTPLGLVAETINPAHIGISLDGRFLYTVNWNTGDRANGDTVTAFAIDRKTGGLTFLNQVSAHGDWANQVVLDPGGQIAITVTYQSGTISALPVEPDGRLGEAFYTDQHAGPATHHALPGPHAHGAVFSREGRFAYVTDLGLDRIYSYRVDAARRQITPDDPAYIDVESGSGPRRLQLHPNGRFLYVNLETTSAVDVFEVSSGRLKEIQSLSTLPAEYHGTNSTAEIQIDRTGHFLYVSNRGHDSIACYRVDPDKGTLTMIENVPSLGRRPKNITIDPTNRYLFAANETGGNVVVFRIDNETGHLTPADVQVPISQPAGIGLAKALP